MSRGTEGFSYRLVLSCEHASAAIPARYRALFASDRPVLSTHRGSDIGSLEMGRHLGRTLHSKLIAARVSRLLVDCNRSPGHRRQFSEWTRGLPQRDRENILARYYYPYRDAVAQRLQQSIDASGRAVHVSVHSFTGSMYGKKRNADIGLLYDPARAPEREFCVDWQARLQSQSTFKVRRNYPYKGVSDGLVTHLRKRFSAQAYIAIELEINQSLVSGRRWATLKQVLASSLASELARYA